MELRYKGKTLAGSGGVNGTTFTPEVSEEGVLSWTNDGGLDNPEPVDIKGPEGQPGENGISPTITTSPNADGDGTIVTITDADGEQEFEVLNGIDGEPGPQGIQGPPGSDATVEAGDGLSKDGDTISVTTPTRGIYTQAEYDALPSSEQTKGLYVTSGGESQPMKIIINGQEVEVGGGGTTEEVYSTEETRIGTWIDGKPLYRKSWDTITPTEVGTVKTLVKNALPNNVDIITNLRVIINRSGHSNSTFASNYYFSNTDYFTVYVDGVNIIMHLTTAFVSKRCCVVVEYTKTTD